MHKTSTVHMVQSTAVLNSFYFMNCRSVYFKWYLLGRSAHYCAFWKDHRIWKNSMNHSNGQTMKLTFPTSAMNTWHKSMFIVVQPFWFVSNEVCFFHLIDLLNAEKMKSRSIPKRLLPACTAQYIDYVVTCFNFFNQFPRKRKRVHFLL